VVASCTSMNLSSNTLKQKWRKLRGETSLTGSKTKQPFKIFLYINRTERENQVQSDCLKEPDHQEEKRVQVSTKAQEKWFRNSKVQANKNLVSHQRFLFEIEKIFI
jgi:hypothetical protein